MKRKLLVIVTLHLFAGHAHQIMAQANHQKTKSTSMETTTKKTGKQVVQEFFTAFGNGDLPGVINSFHDSCKIVGIREAERAGNSLYGTYDGKDGIKAFLSNLGATFDTKAFSVQRIAGEGDIAFAHGKFTHIVKSTGKSFSSDWALVCVIKDQKILEYHFYEDSQKFAEASR
ncbi:MAG TPA: nuclear transport factor 2 family protein [Chryseosolibacter sp.]